MTPAAKAIMQDPPNFAPLVAAEIVFGILFAYIFDKWATISTFVGGLTGGAILTVRALVRPGPPDVSFF